MEKNFMRMMENEVSQRKTLTENGAVAYQTSGKALTDFMFAVTALRQADKDRIYDEITKVYFEDPIIATKFMFFIRDCRGGNGERRIFREYLRWLSENKPKIAKAVIPLVPEYARWDDLWVLLDTSLREDVCELVQNQIEDDMEKSIRGKKISLAAKWLPSQCASSKETKRYAAIIRDYLKLTPRRYRKTLSRLRDYLDVVEVKASSNRWNEIKYETVPSQANLKYEKAFMIHDEKRRKEYLESLKSGKTKINGGVLAPHEIVSRYANTTGWGYHQIQEYDETLEQLWKALPVKSLDQTLVIRDGSGSMCAGYGTPVKPLDVATALAVYTSEHNHGVWKDKYITFSANPKFVDISKCESLRDKLLLSYKETDCTNTNIEKTMMLVLNTAIKNHCSQDDMPKNIIIITDMGFDGCFWGDNTRSLFDNIATEFAEAGYKLPRMVFWNVAGSTNNGIPLQQNELGVVLMSGFSVNLLDMVMSGQLDPYKAILDMINSPRYQPVEDAVKNIN